MSQTSDANMPRLKRQKSCNNATLIAVTGASRSGKTTLSRTLAAKLSADGVPTMVVGQDNYRQSSCDNKMPNGLKTWEGPQFTSWSALHAGVVEASASASCVIVEGYLLLDCDAELRAKFGDRILYVECSRAQVVERRKSSPAGWPSAAKYASDCVWPTHEAYLERVAGILAARASSLPADESIEQRVQRAHALVCGWLAARDAAAATTASTSGSADAAASCSSSAPAPPAPPPAAPPPPIPAAFAPSIPRSRALVLVTHGSFNPVHLGHVDMMVRARDALAAAGFGRVAAGVLAITRASHILGKGAALIAEPAALDTTRLRLLELICAPHARWLRHCGGRGVHVKSGRQFLERHLRDFGPRDGTHALAVSVEGSDVFLRYPHGPPHKGLLLVVARAGEEDAARAQAVRLNSEKQQRVLLLPPDTGALKAVSSTLVREAVERRDGTAVAAMCGEAVAREIL